MTTPETVRRQLPEVAPSPACRDVSDLSSGRRRASVNAKGADGWAPDPGTVAIVHPRVSDAVAKALVRAGFFLVADTGTCQVWVRHPGQPR
jgi:hypothetical protein